MRTRLKWVVEVVAGQSPPSETVYQFEDEGLPFLQGNAEFGALSPKPLNRCDTAPRVCSPGDILLSVRAPVGALNIADRRYGIGRGLAALRTKAGKVLPRYLWWVMHSAVSRLSAFAVGSTYDAVSVDDIQELLIPTPALEQQRIVSDYLDAETARIDAFLAKKERMIELFRARTDSLVEEVTANLRGQCNEVPLKHLVREIDQRLGECTPPEMLSVSIHYGVAPRSQVTDRLPRAEELCAYKMCDRDDIVLNRMRAFQGGVGRSPQAGIVSPDYTVLRPCNIVLSRYLHYIFRSPWFIGQMTARLRGIGDSEQGNVRTPRINFSELGLIRVPVPTVTFQTELVDKLDGEVAQIKAITEKLAYQITLFGEHRQALITAAVTGNLEIPVPEAVA